MFDVNCFSFGVMIRDTYLKDVAYVSTAVSVCCLALCGSSHFLDLHFLRLLSGLVKHQNQHKRKAFKCCTRMYQFVTWNQRWVFFLFGIIIGIDDGTAIVLVSVLYGLLLVEIVVSHCLNYALFSQQFGQQELQQHLLNKSQQYPQKMFSLQVMCCSRILHSTTSSAFYVRTIPRYFPSA